MLSAQSANLQHIYQERQKFVGFMQKAGAVERRGDGREQGFKAPTKFKIWWPAIGSGSVSEA